MEIERCLIAHPLINRILEGLRDSVLLYGFSGEAATTVSPDEGRGVLLLRSPGPGAPGPLAGPGPAPAGA